MKILKSVIAKLIKRLILLVLTFVDILISVVYRILVILATIKLICSFLFKKVKHKLKNN